jgi:hypothetical protein
MMDAHDEFDRDELEEPVSPEEVPSVSINASPMIRLKPVDC